MTYELHVLDVYVYGTSNAVLYCMDSTLQRLRAVCAATARLLLCFLLVVCTSAVDCLERLILEIIYCYLCVEWDYRLYALLVHILKELNFMTYAFIALGYIRLCMYFRCCSSGSNATSVMSTGSGMPPRCRSAGHTHGQSSPRLQSVPIICFT